MTGRRLVIGSTIKGPTVRCERGARSSGDQTPRLLRRVAVVALVDTALLAALLAASLTDSEAWVDVLGPVHGIGFLLELFLAVRGAGERLWGWWFPVAVIVTGGPLGALRSSGGHAQARRRARAAMVAVVLYDAVVALHVAATVSAFGVLLAWPWLPSASE